VAKRLQVILKDPEYREVARAARARHLSIAEWVREALRAARRREPDSEPDKKLSAVRAATRFEFPSGNVGEILAQIEQGYSSSSPI
jgi:hypothetical protein